ncbi:MAG: OB-fold nucleic acid binding domain-containing protein, partial [bacterium]
MKLEDSLQYFKGVGPKRAEHLAASGFQTLEDLLYHLPFRYEDRRVVSRVTELVAGRDVTLVGAISSIKLNSWGGRSRRQVLRATFVDETGRLPLVWFHQGDWFRKKLEGASSWLVHGRVEASKKGPLQIVHPELEALSSDDD